MPTCSRREAVRVAAAAVVAGLASACIPAPAAPSGNQIRSAPTAVPDDDSLKPSRWRTTTVKIGGGFNALTALHFVQELQLPKARIPYVTSMTFYAPTEAPLVTIGLYYERGGDTQAAREVLTSSAFALQAITDLDAPLAYDADQIQTVQSGNISSDALGWFEQNRQAIIDAMKASAEGAALSKSYECDFTTKARPPANTPAALVIAGANYAGFQVPYTVIAQRFLFA